MSDLEQTGRNFGILRVDLESTHRNPSDPFGLSKTQRGKSHHVQPWKTPKKRLNPNAGFVLFFQFHFKTEYFFIECTLLFVNDVHILMFIRSIDLFACLFAGTGENIEENQKLAPSLDCAHCLQSTFGGWMFCL